MQNNGVPGKAAAKTNAPQAFKSTIIFVNLQIVAAKSLLKLSWKWHSAKCFCIFAACLVQIKKPKA
jgi:hypothetical protein